MPVSSKTADRHPETDEAFPYFHATSSGDLLTQSHTLTGQQKRISITSNNSSLRAKVQPPPGAQLNLYQRAIRSIAPANCHLINRNLTYQNRPDYSLTGSRRSNKYRQPTSLQCFTTNNLIVVMKYRYEGMLYLLAEASIFHATALSHGNARRTMGLPRRTIRDLTLRQYLSHLSHSTSIRKNSD